MDEKAKNYIIAVVICVVIAVSSYFLGGYLHPNGTGNDQIRADYQRIEKRLGDIDVKFDGFSKTITESTRRIDSSAARIERSQGDISEVERRLDTDKARLEASKRRLEEAQRILQGARERAERQNK